jgi:paraquat-inducible protein B
MTNDTTSTTNTPSSVTKPQDANAHGVPVAMVRPRRFSWAWLAPFAALCVVSYMLWSQVTADRGTMISIRFHDASGLQIGSEINHRGVRVGIIRELGLDEELDLVLARAELVPGAEQLAVMDTRFWIVHPELSLTRVAGLETLIGPNYIALEPGDPDQPRQWEFLAIDGPPAASRPEDGSLRLTLRSDRKGALASGNPVYYRDIRVGTIGESTLSSDSTSVLTTITIDPKYRPLIKEKTRFWRSGGVGVDFGLFSGLSVQADSLESVISSAISLATPEKKPGEVSSPGDEFELADDANEDWLKWSPEIGIGDE